MLILLLTQYLGSEGTGVCLLPFATWIKFSTLTNLQNASTVKAVVSIYSKKDKTKVLKTGYSIMQVQRVAECSTRAFCNTFDLH